MTDDVWRKIDRNLRIGLTNALLALVNALIVLGLRLGGVHHMARGRPWVYAALGLFEVTAWVSLWAGVRHADL